jgi:uncharacterized protein involved in outer membrane biogenesis
MKKFLYIILGLLVAVIAALVIVPSFINWTKYKDTIETLVKDETGLDLSINGKMKLRILPSPAFAIQNVIIKAPAHCKEKELLNLESAELYLSLWPLLSKKIDIDSLTLIAPKITAELNENCDYKSLFQKKITKNQIETSTKGSTTLFAQNQVMQNADKNLPAIRISKLQIEKGEISLLKDNTIHHLDHIKAELALESLLGPYDIKGSAKLAKQEVDFKVNLGNLLDVQQNPISLALSVEKDNLTLNGHISGGLDNLQFAGKANALLLSKESYLREFIDDLPDALSEPLKLQADINANTQTGNFKNIKMSWGDIRSEGIITYKYLEKKLWDLSGNLKFNPLMMDKLMGKKEKDSDTKKLTFAPPSFISNAFADQKAPQTGFTLPANIKGNLDINFDAIQYGKQLWRDFKINIVLDKGVLSLPHISLPLPQGQAEATLNIQSSNTGLGYNGTFKINTNDLKASAKLFIDAKGLPKTKLDLSSDFSGNFNQIKLTKLKGQSSFLNFGGDAFYDFNDKGIRAKLNIDQLDIDQIIQETSKLSSLRLEDEPKIMLISSNVNSPKEFSLDFLHGPKMDIELACGSMRAKGKTFKNLSANLQLKDETLTIHEAKGQFEGLGFALRGTLQDKDKKADLKFELQSKGKVDKIGDVQLGLHGEGPLDNLKLTSNFFVFGANGNADLTLNVFDPLDHITGNLKMDHPEAGFLFGSNDQWGPFALVSPIEVKKSIINLSNLNGNIGKNAFHATGQMDLTKQKPYLQLNLDLGQIQLSAFEPQNEPKIILISMPAQHTTPTNGGWSRAPLDLSGLEKIDADIQLKASQFLYGKLPIQNLVATSKIRNGTLKIEQFAASLAQGDVKGSGSIHGLERNKITINIQTSGIDFKSLTQKMGNNLPLSGKLNADMNLFGQGHSLYEIMASLQGNGQFNLEQAILEGYDLNAIGQKVQHLRKLNDFLQLFGSVQQGGQTKFEQVQGSAQISNGILRTNDTQVKCQAGSGTIQGNVDLANRLLNLNASFKLASTKNFPPFTANLTGSWDNPKAHLDAHEIESHLLQKGAENIAEKLLNKHQKKDDNQTDSNGEKPKKKKILDELLGQVLHQGENDNPPQNTQPNSEAAPQQEQPTQEQQQPKKHKKGKELLNNLLQGLIQ